MNKHQVVCFGEMLWDILPTGTVPGGAPMNVAYHLKKMGFDPALITRIGSDSWGNDLIKLMISNDISIDYFQIDTLLETGKVNAAINHANNEVTYDILKPAAWDNIQWQDNFEKLVSDTTYFVFGSLATRSTVTRNTLLKLIEIAKFKVLDINLRTPHFTREVLEQLMHNINLLKLNDNELELIAGWFSSYKSDEDQLKILQDRFNIPNIVVTKGSKGAIFNCEGSIYQHCGYKVKVADTVGSGDSFLAALLSKLMEKSSPEITLEFACTVGALIASYNGACPDYKVEEINDLILENTKI